MRKRGDQMKKKYWLFPMILLLFCSIASADLRQDTLASLNQLPHNWPDSGLKAWTNDGRTSHFRIGDEIIFHFQTERDCYIYLIHVDNHGVLSIITPDLGKGDNFLRAGTISAYPAENAGYRITAQPPLGLDHIYVIGLMQRKTFPDDGTYADSEVIAEKVKHILLQGGEPQRTAVVKIQHRVEGRSTEFEYAKRDIVEFYVRTRGVQRIKKGEPFKIRLESHINFDFNSYRLSPQAKVNLDEWGKALLDPSLKDSTWILAGHTDDVGSKKYNLILSRRRAEAVRKYLIAAYGVDPDALSIEAFGESQPIDPRKTEVARATNRRVEFILKP
jgi:outer membrane protein OmpA-like peptidoglycan-associated protein